MWISTERQAKKRAKKICFNHSNHPCQAQTRPYTHNLLLRLSGDLSGESLFFV